MVTSDWTYEPFRARPVVAGDAYSAIPLWAQLGGLAAVAIGTARNVIDRFVELAASKVPTGNMSRLAERAAGPVRGRRGRGPVSSRHTPRSGSRSKRPGRAASPAEPFDNETLARLRLGSVTATRLAAEAVDLLHDAAGMSAVKRGTVLERCSARHAHDDSAHHLVAGSIRDRRTCAPRSRSRQPGDLEATVTRDLERPARSRRRVRRVDAAVPGLCRLLRVADVRRAPAPDLELDPRRPHGRGPGGSPCRRCRPRDRGARGPRAPARMGAAAAGCGVRIPRRSLRRAVDSGARRGRSALRGRCDRIARERGGRSSAGPPPTTTTAPAASTTRSRPAPRGSPTT